MTTYMNRILEQAMPEHRAELASIISDNGISYESVLEKPEQRIMDTGVIARLLDIASNSVSNVYNKKWTIAGYERVTLTEGGWHGTDYPRRYKKRVTTLGLIELYAQIIFNNMQKSHPEKAKETREKLEETLERLKVYSGNHEPA